MKRIFIAGKYNDTDVIKVLRNIRDGQRAAVDVLMAGMAPFCPWLDYQFGLHAEIPMQAYKGFTLAFLPVCDAALFLPSWKRSGGAKVEHDMCEELGIPIFYDFKSLREWNDEPH
jgi:hypothetical protein